jgi:hypothetical protein
MENDDRPKNASGEKEGAKRRYPPLTLEDPDPVSPTFRPLDEKHEMYPLAAWAWWHANDLPPAARRGLFVALARAWPAKGRRKSRHYRGFFAALLKKANIETARIAKTLCVTEGEVNDLARDYRNDLHRQTEGRPRIHVESVDDDDKPYDPSTKLGAILSHHENHGNEDWQRVDRLAQELGHEDMTDLLKTADRPAAAPSLTLEELAPDMRPDAA